MKTEHEVEHVGMLLAKGFKIPGSQFTVRHLWLTNLEIVVKKLSVPFTPEFSPANCSLRYMFIEICYQLAICYGFLIWLFGLQESAASLEAEPECRGIGPGFLGIGRAG